MKQYITIAALIAAGATFASADDEQTLYPLLEVNPETGKTAWDSVWTESDDAYRAPSINGVDNGTYKWNANWPMGHSTYNLSEAIALDSADDYLKFSYTIKPQATTNALMTLALVGAQGAVITGYNYKSPISWATTDEIAESYAFTGDNTSWVAATVDGNALTNSIKNRKFYISGDVAWDSTLSNFVLNIVVKDDYGTFVASNPVNLGDAFEISELIITTDGGNQSGDKSYPTLSNLALTWGHYNIPVPEPAAFGLLAGLGALALAGTRRRRK